MSLPEHVSQSSFDEAPELRRNAIAIVPPTHRKGPQRALTPKPAWPIRFSPLRTSVNG
jgi:hypothetical protein